MAPYSDLGAADIVRLIRERELSCVEVAAGANIAIAKLDGPIHAFAAEAGDRAIERACPSRSRTSLTPPTFRPSTASRSTLDTAHAPTRRWSACCGQPAR